MSKCSIAQYQLLFDRLAACYISGDNCIVFNLNNNLTNPILLNINRCGPITIETPNSIAVCNQLSVYKIMMCLNHHNRYNAGFRLFLSGRILSMM